MVDQNWNPTRLVEIGKKGICSRLYINHQFRVPVRSATLLHRWGNISNKTILTEKSKARFEKDLFEPSLPKTFRDAITAARRLNFDYIWIGSLCIIQDSQNDWLHESFQMAKVYQHSSLTITATASADDDGG